MKAKKLICIILCLVLSFTLLSGPWRAEAEAASGVAAIVLAIVGTFVVSAGYSFATKGELQTATEAFMTSDAAKYVTNISDYVSDIIRLNNATTVFDLAPIVTSEWFIEFWQAILDFFCDGEVEIDNSSPAPAEGMAFYNGYELPLISKTAAGALYPYQIIYYSSDIFYLFQIDNLTSGKVFAIDSQTVRYSGCNTIRRTLSNNSWSDSNFSYSVTGSRSIIIWSNVDLLSSDGTQILFEGTTPVTEGNESIDTIPVITDSSYYNPDVVTAWVEEANNGAIDWALDSSSVYQDVTSADKTAPITATQTGVLTDAGVNVATIEKTMGDYAVSGLTSIFPFCIPFDVYNFFSVLTAEREAPHFEFVLNFGDLGSHPINVDLSEWETVATVLRTIELLGFCIGLALATSKLIKW